MAAFEELLTDSVRGAVRDSATHLTIRLQRYADLEAATRVLAARETECCPFFDFTVTPDGPGVVLGVGAPPQHASILDSLQARAGAIA
jgi:hypothetical protein